MSKNANLLSYDDFMGELLQDPNFVEEYLNEKLESGDSEQFLLALGNIAKARGGITNFAKKTGLGRQTIYKALSGKGNPTFKSFQTILDAAGFHLKVEAIKKKPRRSTKRKLTSA